MAGRMSQFSHAQRLNVGALLMVTTSCMLMLLLLLEGSTGVAAEDDGSGGYATTLMNKSQKKVVLVALDVDVEAGPLEVEVGAGASVQLPPGHYRFQRAGRHSAPVPLLGLSLLAIVDGAAPGTIDVCVAVDVLGIIELGITLVIGL